MAACEPITSSGGVAVTGEAPGNTLTLVPASTTLTEVRGFFRTREVSTRVEFEDFHVDGTGLYARLNGGDGAGTEYDVTTGLRPDWPQETVESLHRLLGLAPPDLPGGRTSLYLCMVCGDLGCATLSARIQLLPDQVRWVDLGWQSENIDDVEPEPGLGPYAFPRPGYERVLREALRRHQPPPGSPGT